jgi:hypothetical protein
MAKMNEMELSKKALKFVLKKEGGYVNDPDDSGGATNFGITQFTYNNYLKSQNEALKNVKVIQQLEVEAIYYNNYWRKVGCPTMHPVFAVLAFDTAINHGPDRVKDFMKAANYADADKFILARIFFYKNLAQRRPKDLKFLCGWLNRVEALIAFINTEITKG